jgi:hypothetical protein
VTQRLGYTASAGLYLPAVNANGVTVSVVSGTATAYAGLPSATSHRALSTIGAGQQYQITGLAAGEVVSIQSYAPFTFDSTAPGTTDPGTVSGSGSPPNPGTTPASGDEIHSVQAYWICDLPDCDNGAWVGAVINWPSWSAYQNNARPYQPKKVVNAAGEPLYPYMGSWANGCKVTGRSGVVLIIEWQRGTDVWRETWLEPGQSHVISLTAPEDGAMIETYDFSPGFSVSLENCTPQPLP